MTLQQRVSVALCLLYAPWVAVGAPPDEPLDVRAAIAAAGDAERHKSDEVVVLDHTDVTVRPNGIGESRYHTVVKILREDAVRSNSVQRVRFDPFTNRIKLEALRVYRSNGDLGVVPLDFAQRQPAPAGTIFWGEQQYLIETPRLEVGDAVELIYTKIGYNVAYLAGEDADGGALEPPMPGHWHDEARFWSATPLIEKRYTVRAPRDKPIQYAVYNGELRTAVHFDGDHVVYSFEKRDIPKFEREPHSVPAGDVACKLVLATLEDWESKSRWFHEANKDSFESSDEIRAMVRQVISGCQTDDEKITALNHWVAENIRYVGTTRGACEGYTTHKSRETFRDRGGVCKDKAGMLVTLLRDAGFESHIVMTMARSEVFPVPADQFNHAVTCVRRGEGTLQLLDPTWMPKSRDNWSTFEPEQHVVYGVPEGLPLMRSPYFPPEENLATWSSSSAIDERGTLSSQSQFAASGGPETLLRRRLAGMSADERHRLFGETFARVSPSIRLSKLECMDAVDYSGPIAAEVAFEAHDYVLGAGKRLYFKLPGLNRALADIVLSDLDGTYGKKERVHAVMTRATRMARFEETLRLPAGWKVSDAPKAVTIDGPAASLSFEIETPPGEIRYRCELAVKNHRIAPANYANYKEALEKLDELTDAVLVCDREGASARR